MVQGKGLLDRQLELREENRKRQGKLPHTNLNWGPSLWEGTTNDPINTNGALLWVGLHTRLTNRGKHRWGYIHYDKSYPKGGTINMELARTRGGTRGN